MAHGFSPTISLPHSPSSRFSFVATKNQCRSLLLHKTRLRRRSYNYKRLSFMASAHCSDTTSPCTSPSLLVFSGGTAFNGVVEELKKVTTRVAHVLPVSDDGGSTAEIVRVLGGPAVGDIRSRCLRLSDESTSEALAARRLLGHRLPLDPSKAKLEWHKIVEGEDPLWDGVSRPYRETIRAFLVYFQNQILRRSDESFCFSNGSIGNFFFAGARIFFQSLDAAIFLFSRVSQIPTESLVLPVISTNDRLTLGCELWDGTIIRGQNEISHPTNGRTEQINKDYSSCSALPLRIKRVFYMSSEGSNLLHEVFPTANPMVLDQLRKVDCIVYGMGSLFTSICPSLVLQGIGEIISSRSIPKVLLLNGTHDRETAGLSASGFVTAITDSLNRTYGAPNKSLNNLPSDYINAILVPRDGQVPVDIDILASQGIFHVVSVDSIHDRNVGVIFEPQSLIKALTDLMHETTTVAGMPAKVFVTLQKYDSANATVLHQVHWVGGNATVLIHAKPVFFFGYANSYLVTVLAVLDLFICSLFKSS